MKKIISLNLTRLYVKEIGSLGRNVVQTATASPANGIIPQKILADISAALVVYDGAVGKITPSEAAALSVTLDDERDNIILGLKGLAMASRYRNNDAIKSAGRKVEDAIRRRGWQMQADSYLAETNEINQLLADINASAELKSAVTALNADELIVQLADANKRFEDNERARVEAGVAKGNITSAQAVGQLRSSILTLFNFLNSVAGVYPEVVTTINSINGVIEPFTTQLKTRVTSTENAKMAAKADEAKN